MSAPAFLDIEGITVRFGGLVAVNKLSFQVERGTMHETPQFTLFINSQSDRIHSSQVWFRHCLQ